MFDPLVMTLLAVLGLLFGSFAGATVWRLRARQLVADKKAGEAVDAKELKQLKPLAHQKVLKDRSRCLSCGYTLRWYDLIPIVSWLSLKGRCRSCRKPIGRMEPLLEVGMAVFFVASYIFWPFLLTTPLEVAFLAVWLLAGVGLIILFAYDAKWYLLPNSVTFTVVALGVVSVVLRGFMIGNWESILFNTLGAVGVLSGIYLVLYLVSKGRWIGFGDIKLGLALGLLLADWQLALLALFAANLLGCLVVIPFLLTKKLSRTSQVPFGPFLIIGMIVTQLFGWYLLEWTALGVI